MKKQITILAAIITSFTALAQKPVTDKRLAALDTAFERVLRTWKTPGFAVAVVEKKRVIHMKGYGYRDVEKKLPVTPETIFAIGSCTKAFTTSLIGLLDSDNKLDMDKPASQYLPGLSFYEDELTLNVTLRDMMSHRTGLPRHDYSWYLFSTGNRDSLWRRIQYQEPTFPLRSRWQYNNFMFVTQGAIAENITGKSWEENIREKILDPLGMNKTKFSFSDYTSTDNLAAGYFLKNDSLLFKLPYYNISSAGPAGSITSSAAEMANWLITWINGGKFNNKEVLPAAFVSDAMSSQTVIGAGFPGKEKPSLHFNNYGLGWFLSSYKGHYRVEHGGNIDGFSASTVFYPTDSIGIVVLVNQDASSVPSIIRNLITDKLLGLPYYDWNNDLRGSFEKTMKQAREAMASQSSARVTGTKPSHTLYDYEGIYNHAGYGSFDVFVRNDSLLALVPGKTIHFKHYHYDIFSPHILNDPRFDTSENTPFRVQFITGLSGEIESLRMHGFEAGTINLEFKRTPRAREVSKESMKEFEGSYMIAGTEIKFYLKGSQLYMFVPGQPEYELVPVEKDKFSLKILSGYSVQFLRDEKGALIAVNLIQPNGTFKAEKKK